MADLTKFLSLGGLQRYDSKIKAFIADKVAGHLLFQLAEKLEDIKEPKNNVIYLIPNKGETQNIKDEFMWIDGKWELIGTTSVDLSGYYTKVVADAKFETIVNADLVRGRVSGLETRMTTAEGNITTLQGAVATKAESADLTALQGTVSGMYTNAQIDEKVAGEVATINAEIAKKANAADVYTKGEVDGKVTTINAAIDTKATKATTLEGYGITDAYTTDEVDGLIDSVVNAAGALEDRVEANEGAITALQGAVATKAAQSDLEALQGTVNGMYTNAQIDEKVAGEVATINDEIAKKANAADVYTKGEVDGKVTTINEAIATKAAQSDLTALQGTVSGMYTNAQIDEKVAGEVATINAEIAKKAAQSDLTAEVQAREALAGVVDTKAAQSDLTAEVQAREALASNVYTKSEVYTKDEVDAMVISDAEIDALFTTANA